MPIASRHATTKAITASRRLATTSSARTTAATFRVVKKSTMTFPRAIWQ